MYLSNSVRDFESLIKTIQLEVGWDEKNDRYGTINSSKVEILV